jgi:hypothetical protein
MKKTLFLFLISIGFSSCQFFETEKISSETIIENEIKSINWNDVDSYPIFKECEGVSGKLETKSCFETILASHLYNSLQVENVVVLTEINDTIVIDFMVNEKGELSISNMKIDSVLSNQLPLLENKIIQGLDSLQPIAPAYKRGIPVKTTFKLPIVIKTNS